MCLPLPQSASDLSVPGHSQQVCQRLALPRLTPELNGLVLQAMMDFVSCVTVPSKLNRTQCH